MRIKEIQIENFKLFKDKSFSFDQQFNLLIGENGSGKTSLLRAVAIALGGWAHAYIDNAKNRRPIEEDEVREVQIDSRFDKTKTTSIKVIGEAVVVDHFGSKKNATAKWTRRKSEGLPGTFIEGNIKYGQYHKIYNLNFSTLGSDILDYIEKGKKFDLPLIAFYECNRLWLPDNKLNLEASAKNQPSRFDPYVDCFHTAADHEAVGAWILKHELASIQQKQETPVLSSIKSAAKAALEGCIGLKFDFEKSRIMIEFKDGITIPFEHLSDGQRTMLGLFCDLARRAAILNPHFEGDANQKTQGVVLIDELDLHLHPKWQRQIIHSLKTSFPLIQFICTTHSPFLIQSLRNGKLIQLSEEADSDFYNESIEDIVEDIQGVHLPQKSKRYSDMILAAERYYQAINDSQDKKLTDELKVQLDELMIPFSDDPAFVAQLKFEREAILLTGQKNK